MKKINYFFAAAMICMSVAACVKEAGNDNPGVNSGNTTEETIPENYIELTFQVPGMDVKTSVDGNTVSWTQGDKIRICWDGGSSVSNAVVLEEGNASFTAMVAPEATDFYAVYPSTIEASVTEGNFNVTIPSSQSGRFADADIIVAKTSKENLAFAFHHAVSLVKFVISDENQKGISRAQFVDIANNSQLTGALSIAFDEENAISANTVVEKTTEEINAGLDVIDVTAVQPGDNYMAVLPSKSLAGFGLRLGSESKWYSGLVSESPVVVERLPLGTVDTKIHEGDFYVTPDGGASEKDGKSWETAYPASMLKSLIHNHQTTATGYKSLARGWRIDGKTIHIAEGTYDSGYICSFDGYKDGEDDLVTFTIKGGYTSIGTAGNRALIGSDNAEPKVSTRGFFFYTGSKVTLDNICISNHTHEKEGPALYLNGDADVTIKDCLLEGNVSTTQGGALFITENSKATVTGSTFKGNQGSNGGAIRVDKSSRLTLIGCNFLDNVAEANGGAVVAVGSTNITSCTFNGNIAGNQGGAIWAATNPINTLSECTFESNKAAHSEIKGDGGAIYSSVSVKADRCKFLNNIVEQGNSNNKNKSGVVRVAGDTFFNSCEFRGNGSSYNTAGKVIYNTTATNIVAFNNCLFLENGNANWTIYSAGPVIMVNSTMIDASNGAELLRTTDTNSILYNNIVINTGTASKAGIGNCQMSHNYNIVNAYATTKTSSNDVTGVSSLESGIATKYDTFQAGKEAGISTGMSYYSWSGNEKDFTCTSNTNVANTIKSNETFGLAFYNWLDELVEGTGTALDYDIRGVARTETVWPGSYQN